MKDEKNRAEKHLIELQRMKAEEENQGMAAMQQARQSYQLVEDAVLERDQVRFMHSMEYRLMNFHPFLMSVVMDGLIL